MQMLIIYVNRLDIGDDKVQVFAELFDNDVTLEYTDGDGNTVSAGNSTTF